MSLTPAVPPAEYRRALSSLRTIADLACLLDISPGQLRRYSYGNGRRYRVVDVPKRRGGTRIISQPADGLKIVQQKLATLLSASYRSRDCVHGFVNGRSIATNAAVHANRRWVLNVDLVDFFPSINFGRVRGRLMARPYALPEKVATVVAQLCCRDNELPQGAPTSPVLSNIVCSGMDAGLQRLASRHGCTYTRYADDLTFSTDSQVFPSELARRVGAAGSSAVPGGALEAALVLEGFRIHSDKVRLQRFDTRQVVTGLVVNEFPNLPRKFVRRVWAMLRAWRVFGYDAAEREFRAQHDNKYRPFGPPRFKAVVKGHIDFIGMVRGGTDPIYEDLLREYASVDAEHRLRPRSRRRRHHIPSYRDAIWVVEWDWGQGTAFELEGHGLVTCSHVLRGTNGAGDLVEVQEVEAWQPRAPDMRISATVVWDEPDRDVAVLKLEQPSGRPLPVGPLGTLELGSEVWAAGYPNQTPGSGLWRAQGPVTRFDHHVGSPRYTVGFTIVTGASGSPVLDRQNRVVGLASMGASSFEEAARRDSMRFGVIPIGLVVNHDFSVSGTKPV